MVCRENITFADQECVSPNKENVLKEIKHDKRSNNILKPVLIHNDPSKLIKIPKESITLNEHFQAVKIEQNDLQIDMGD